MLKQCVLVPKTPPASGSGIPSCAWQPNARHRLANELLRLCGARAPHAPPCCGSEKCVIGLPKCVPSAVSAVASPACCTQAHLSLRKTLFRAFWSATLLQLSILFPMAERSLRTRHPSADSRALRMPQCSCTVPAAIRSPISGVRWPTVRVAGSLWWSL